jgi:plastocyanin
MKRALGAVALVAIAALAFVACGGGGDDSSMNHSMESGMDMGSGSHKNAAVQAGAREISVDAKSFAFKPSQITLEAGENVTIVLEATDVAHDFVVQGQGHVVGANAGKQAKGGLVIDKPGTYEFWCSVSGHRTAGMEGTLIVQ